MRSGPWPRICLAIPPPRFSCATSAPATTHLLGLAALVLAEKNDVQHADAGKSGARCLTSASPAPRTRARRTCCPSACWCASPRSSRRRAPRAAAASPRRRACRSRHYRASGARQSPRQSPHQSRRRRRPLSRRRRRPRRSTGCPTTTARWSRRSTSRCRSPTWWASCTARSRTRCGRPWRAAPGRRRAGAAPPPSSAGC